MLGKLMKHELKACGRIFIPLYIVILCVAAISGIFSNTQMVQIPAILIFLLMALFVALGVMTVVLILQRFKKNLLEDEGYLMFTLPVSTKSLILSKYLTSVVYMVLSTIVSILAFVIILFLGGSLDTSVYMEFWNAINQVLAQRDFVVPAIMVIISGFLSYTLFIFTVYLAVSIGQLPVFNKNRILFGMISFFVINIIVATIQSFVKGIFIVNAYENVGDIYSVLSAFNLYSVISIITNIVIIIILFIATNYILNRKLNLE